MQGMPTFHFLQDEEFRKKSLIRWNLHWYVCCFFPPSLTKPHSQSSVCVEEVKAIQCTFECRPRRGEVAGSEYHTGTAAGSHMSQQPLCSHPPRQRATSRAQDQGTWGWILIHALCQTMGSFPPLLVGLSSYCHQEYCSEPFPALWEQDFHHARDHGVWLASTDCMKMQCVPIKSGGHSRQMHGFSQFC